MSFDPTHPQSEDAREDRPASTAGRSPDRESAGKAARGLLGGMAGLALVMLAGLLVLIVLVIVL